MMLQHGGGWMGSAEDMTPIGIWTELREDDTGLYAEGKLAIDHAARQGCPHAAEDDAATGAERPVDRLPGQGIHLRHQARRCPPLPYLEERALVAR